MIDITQLILGFVIITLTVLITVIGIQVFFILHEFRQTIQKTNKVLDSVKENLSEKYGNVATESVKKVKKLAKTVQSQLPSLKKRRFFKSKKPL